MDERPKLTADSAIAYINRVQGLSSREFRLTIAICNPGGLSCHQTIDAVGMQSGFDWTAGQIIIEPVQPLTILSPEDVKAITMSAREGQSWHAYQRENRIRSLEAEVSRLKTLLKEQA